MKKRSLFALLICLCLLICCGCDSAKNRGFYLYKSSPLGFRIEYPETWTKQVDVDNKIAAFVTPMEGLADAYRDNLTVSYEEKGDNTLEARFEEYYSLLPSRFAGFTEESKEEVLLDEKEAYKIVFSSSQTTKNDQGKEVLNELCILQYMVEVENRIYFITFIAQPDGYEYFMPYIETMLETLSFDV